MPAVDVRSRRLTPLLTVALVLGYGSSFVAQGTPDATALLRQSLGAQRPPALRAEASLQTTTAGGAVVTLRIRLLAKLQEDGVHRRVRTRIVSGGTLVGSGFLVVEHPQGQDLWVFLPAIASPRRLVASNLGDSYFGSEFRIGDLTQLEPDDYAVALLGEDTVAGGPCWRVEITPRTPRLVRDTGIGRQVLCLARDTLLERRIEQFSPNGAPLKVVQVNGWREVAPGKWFAEERLIRNVPSGASSRVVFTAIGVPKDVPDTLFTVGALPEAF